MTTQQRRRQGGRWRGSPILFIPAYHLVFLVKEICVCGATQAVHPPGATESGGLSL
jgi:hypothetical protein